MPLSHWWINVPLALLLMVLGAAAAVTALRGRAGTLTRDGRLGVRSAASMDSEVAFTAANRVAWPVVAAAALVALLTGALLAIADLSILSSVLIFLVAAAGVVALLVQAAKVGHRAATLVPRPARKPEGAGCGGCGCGGGGCARLERLPTAGAGAADSTSPAG